MPKIDTVFARLTLKAYNDTFTLNEVPREINERLYDVLNDDFYLKKLTQTVCDAYPEKLAEWIEYRAMRTPPRPQDISAIAKFTIFHQKVDLIDIRFY